LNLLKHKALFLVIVGISALIVASPALQKLLVYPQTEYFTEMWLLDASNHTQAYPHNITKNFNYEINLGLANHLGTVSYYQVMIKFRNETQLEGNPFNRTYSTQPSLYNITAIVADKETWELPLTFAFDYTSQSVTNPPVNDQPSENSTQVNYLNLKLNDVTLNLQGYSSAWNSTSNEHKGSLIFELWIYNSTIQDFQYHQRFLALRLNMTVPNPQP
jgi:uncharacterized membrane protein